MRHKVMAMAVTDESYRGNPKYSADQNVRHIRPNTKQNEHEFQREIERAPPNHNARFSVPCRV